MWLNSLKQVTVNQLNEYVTTVTYSCLLQIINTSTKPHFALHILLLFFLCLLTLYSLQVLIGSLYCLCPLWLARAITFVLRHNWKPLYSSNNTNFKLCMPRALHVESSSIVLIQHDFKSWKVEHFTLKVPSIYTLANDQEENCLIGLTWTSSVRVIAASIKTEFQNKPGQG